MALSALNRGRLARAQLAVNLNKCLVNCFCIIFFNGCLYPFVVTKEVEYLLIGTKTESSD